MTRSVPIFLLSCLLVACSESSSTHSYKHDSFITKIKEANTEYPSGGISAENYLKNIAYTQVEGFPQHREFFVAQRSVKMTKFRCSSCHEGDLSSPQSATEQKAHWDIELKHSGKVLGQCTICHNPANLDTLISLENKPIEFDHSYQLCAQCHFQQVSDWAGGAHGKRLGGWALPRVINNCTECHNPHSPKLEKRWPAISRTLPE